MHFRSPREWATSPNLDQWSGERRNRYARATYRRISLLPPLEGSVVTAGLVVPATGNGNLAVSQKTYQGKHDDGHAQPRQATSPAHVVLPP